MPIGIAQAMPELFLAPGMLHEHTWRQKLSEMAENARGLGADIASLSKQAFHPAASAHVQRPMLRGHVLCSSP